MGRGKREWVEARQGRGWWSDGYGRNPCGGGERRERKGGQYLAVFGDHLIDGEVNIL
jgi:hypothetical protein